ncbi:MAG: cysteine desulfurase/selenocysteine lyase, cysteine desulfurase / selenocysteine lyase [Candidatus Gottesmanbacteria bacterium GW2011_GWA2_43_14]|uniref:cysteine desulfurase n=1 Tax=Candidatus Gottesmanbacteria bacterium GW2011_GWA2_43_14 TaxID=1618443 RepID=A0A0G1GBZ5_9BACT|nr:MAG: cysteine desulfurase/selenocysteine lyase, cysteine desulfurase / selenocysteine lyase [Candidatus Gottesmanbacteria bacterium GW2011_GWA2_43_14]
MNFNPSKIAGDFPVLSRKINGAPIVYLDSTASSLKPLAVIEEIDRYYRELSVNIFRGVYNLSEEATALYENARQTAADFIGASSASEIVFTRNATESLNLLAASLTKKLAAGSGIVSTVMEHHANIVPWQVAAGEKDFTLSFVDIDENGKLDLADLRKKINKKTAVFTFTYVSNVLGTINPVREIISQIKKINSKIIIIVDAAQAVPHMPLNVQDLGADFMVFSSHKMCGPTGIGVLWGKQHLLEMLPPYQTGGEMIREVRLDSSTYNESPYKFEAGTPHIAGAMGLAAAMKYLQGKGLDKIRQHEIKLTAYALEKLKSIENVAIYGPEKAENRGGVIAFNLKGVHPHDVAQILNSENICIRSGHHCAMPLHTRLNIGSSCRASFYLYNSEKDVDALLQGLKNTAKFFLKKRC